MLNSASVSPSTATASNKKSYNIIALLFTTASLENDDEMFALG